MVGWMDGWMRVGHRLLAGWLARDLDKSGGRSTTSQQGTKRETEERNASPRLALPRLVMDWIGLDWDLLRS